MCDVDLDHDPDDSFQLMPPFSGTCTFVINICSKREITTWNRIGNIASESVKLLWESFLLTENDGWNFFHALCVFLVPCSFSGGAVSLHSKLFSPVLCSYTSLLLSRNCISHVLSSVETWQATETELEWQISRAWVTHISECLGIKTK